MIDIFDKLNAAYGDQTLADSDQIKDKKFGKKQDVLNKEILDPDDPNSLKSKVDSFNGIVIDPDNVVSTDKSDIEVGSSKIPTGNAVAGALSDAMLKAGVFDISAYNLTNDQPTPYADLEAALGNNGENVPEAVRKGGMQVKFIQGSVGSSDNKYVQYRLMATSWSTVVTDWQGVDDEPTAGSNNLVKSGGTAEVIRDVASQLGINGAFEVNDASTDYVIDVRGLEVGKYCIALNINTQAPYVIKCYRTKRYKSQLIDSPKYDLPTHGTVIEIEKTEDTNYLWLFLAQEYTYSAEFYIVKKGYFYDKIMGSIGDINQSISDINSTVGEVQNDVDALEAGLDTVSSKVDYFHPSVVAAVELPVYRTDQKSFIASSGAVESFNSYDVIVYSVANIPKVKISGRGGTTTVRVYAFYSSDTLGTSTLVGTVGPEHTTNYDYEVNVPAGAVYMACTKYKDQTLLSVTHEGLQPDKKTVKEIKVDNGNKVTISVPSNNKKLYMIIGSTSEGVGNGLIDFRYWGYAPLQSGVEAVPVKLYDSTSDCFGPFQIKAINNIDGDDTSNDYFTGGSHQYNNGITGSTPTARLGNVEILVDGVKQTSFSGSFTTFEMTWENYIQATNTRKIDGTGREVLKEIISLKYVDGEFKCCTELVPLEDITLHLFYGYQICGINPGGIYNISDHWRYVNGTNRELDALESGNKDTIAMIGDSSTFHQEMWIDNSIDMGKREMCINNTTNGAFKSGSKGYFTIANNDSTLYADNHYYLYGKYVFALKSIV